MWAMSQWVAKLLLNYHFEINILKFKDLWGAYELNSIILVQLL